MSVVGRVLISYCVREDATEAFTLAILRKRLNESERNSELMRIAGILISTIARDCDLNYRSGSEPASDGSVVCPRSDYEFRRAWCLVHGPFHCFWPCRMSSNKFELANVSIQRVWQRECRCKGIKLSRCRLMALAGCGSSWLADPVLGPRPPSSTRPYLLVRKGLLREEGQQGHGLTAAAARKSAKNHKKEHEHHKIGRAHV